MRLPDSAVANGLRRVGRRSTNLFRLAPRVGKRSQSGEVGQPRVPQPADPPSRSFKAPARMYSSAILVQLAVFKVSEIKRDNG
jgi:hypothetical protein